MMDGATAQWGISGPAAANSARTDTLRTGTFSIWKENVTICEMCPHALQYIITILSHYTHTCLCLYLSTRLCGCVRTILEHI